MRVLESNPAIPCPGPEAAVTQTHPERARHGRATTDPGRKLYEERSTALAGLWMPPALPWEDLPEPDKNRWRGYAAVPGNDGAARP
ncbi:hypothetical protein QFZ61_001297 [Arthrobacter sp. B3I4]|nr:hypothetical protein [Arthrobacter sp. B3I4]